MTAIPPAGRVLPSSEGALAGPGDGPRKRRFGKASFDSVSFFVVFLGIPLALFLIFVIWPFVQACFYALTDWSGFSAEFNVIGLDNFATLLSDPRFVNAVGNSVMFGIFIPLITIAIALTFAILITVGGSGKGQIRGVRGSGFYRVVSLFPYVIPGIAVAIMWRLILDPSNGLVNGILTGLGLERFQSFAWLGNVATAMPVTMFVVVWGFVGFYMLLFIAAIKGVPAETYEAARIDGAGRMRMSWSITLPLIRDNVQTAYIYVGIIALDLFVYVQGLNPQGGPDNSTLVMSQQLFRSAFTEGKFGYASAMGVSMAIVTLVFAALVFGVNRLTGGKDEGGKQ
ncbi:carbohydrate ABC transporter permease [Isoptericola cucumis]|uniref:Sugar ABC transporter permease n=2 Tax=Isoptericola cucumis TaxID=1776856 RepID=A0ABQ2B5K2_9MICO|nr:sugar ABC transporter permease [Isoptericola cucumis]GGI07044.1 sugar ABC transporter permease [Isoptericola cucumis]